MRASIGLWAIMGGCAASATWPVVGRRVPAPASLPGPVLRPAQATSPDPPVAALPPLAPPSAVEAWLTEGGTRLWVWDRRGGDPVLRVGPADRPDAPDVTVPWRSPFPGWVVDAPEGAVAVTRQGRVWRLAPDGTGQGLAAFTEAPVWVEARPDGVWIGLATDDGGLRGVSLDAEGAVTERFAHPTADDVALDGAGVPRLWLIRTRVHHGLGVSADDVQVLGPDGRPWGAPFRQVTWLDDPSPVPRIGNGPVFALGGGELATLGVLDVAGFTPQAPIASQWADATALFVDPDDGAVDAVGWSAERLHWDARDADGEALVALSTRLGADVRVTGRAPGDRRWIVQAWSGAEWPGTWLFDRDADTLVRLGAALPGERFAVDAFVLRARDGRPLAAYLTRPASEPPWPLIVSVHGGPWSGRDTYTVSPGAQRAAAQGYATLAVDFRGTHGFGWSVTHGPEGLFGGPMIGDVEDGIDRALAQGLADPDRIAIVGASYGGYAALRFATAERPRVRCAVGGLVRGNLTVPGGGLVIRGLMTRRWRAAHSPDRFTERLAGPVLVYNGAQDGENADVIGTFVERAQAHGKPVLWVRMPWEGHGVDNPVTREALQAVIDGFLARCLGGPARGFPETFADADLEVRGDVSLVPGLAARLR